ncbi:MAG: helix-turn-helix transcriptional regulator [Elusimicrobia bacterium]|nr:helix-turn-helix transcriptional regulator [Elusimicrobiota bacterium]
MDTANPNGHMASLLKQLRCDRGISQLQLADQAGVNVSVVNRAESGKDARLSTWDKLFEGLGYRLRLDVAELSEEVGALLSEEADWRREKRRQGLCAGKRRFY